jgi:quinol-cytochrome oxidoreductase complex cytochrome b subunit
MVQYVHYTLLKVKISRQGEKNMSFQEKNVTVSLVNFTLILGFYLIRLFQMIQSGSFNSTNVFRLWGIVVVLVVVVTILATILTHIVSAIIQGIKTKEEPDIENIQDERDKLIDLRGTKVTYFVSSIGGFLSMLTFALGQPPLVMFTLLIFFGVVAQIIGDISRLYLYRRGF